VSTLRLYFLRPLDVRYDGQQLPKPAMLKSQSLLAYLILHRHQPQPRERLAGLFWGDRPERKARRSLATALWHIRRCREVVQAELGAEPVAEAAKLYQAILGGGRSSPALAGCPHAVGPLLRV
jgi:hypothetical protein